MTIGKFERPGTLPKPGPIGRAVRILGGIFFLGLFILTVTSYTEIVSSDVPTSPMLWIGVASIFLFVGYLVNVGFTLNWGLWPQAILILLAVGAVVLDLSIYGSFWAPPLGLLVFLLLAFLAGQVGLSLILAASLAVPG